MNEYDKKCLLSLDGHCSTHAANPCPFGVARFSDETLKEELLRRKRARIAPFRPDPLPSHVDSKRLTDGMFFYGRLNADGMYFGTQGSTLYPCTVSPDDVDWVWGLEHDWMWAKIRKGERILGPGERE